MSLLNPALNDRYLVLKKIVHHFVNLIRDEAHFLIVRFPYFLLARDIQTFNITVILRLRVRYVPGAKHEFRSLLVVCQSLNAILKVSSGQTNVFGFSMFAQALPLGQELVGLVV